MKRLCILQVCPLERELKQYVYYLAEKLQEISDSMVIVANGGVKDCDRRSLRKMHLNVYERPDAGFDCGAFKDTLENYLTWKRVHEYDELILVNDSCYGPIFPLDEMFHEMDTERADLDFWTVTEQPAFGKMPSCEESIPYHVQPYFAVIRKRLLHSPDFSDFWRSLTVPKKYWEAIENYELKFAAFFAGRGYRGGAYVDYTRFYKSDEEKSSYILFDICRLLREERCPFLKRRSFKHSQADILKMNAGETARRALDYVWTYTAYPVELIWEDLVQELSPKTLHLTLHLDYIVGSRHQPVMGETPSRLKVFVYVRDMDFAQACQKRLNVLPSGTEVYIYSEREKIKKFFDDNTDTGRWKIIDSRKGEWAEKLRLEESDYVCFIIDDTDAIIFPYYGAKLSYIESIWDHMWFDSAYAENVVSVFEREKRLGLLTPPEPYFSAFFTRSFGAKSSDEIFTSNHTFWLRTAAIKDFLSDPFKGDRPFLGTVLPEVVRKAGFYSGILMEEHWVPVFTTNYYYMLERLTKNVVNDISCTGEGAEFFYANPEIFHFCHKYKKIYIYGAGMFGHHCLNYLSQNEIEFKGFVVSDGQKEKNYDAWPIYELSEIELGPDEGIIVGVGKEHVRVIENELKRRKISRFVRYMD